MKTLTLLTASLFLAASAFAQAPKKKESKAASTESKATPAATKATPAPSKAATAGFPPIHDIHAHVCGIHFYSGDLGRQIIAEHYCSHLSDEVLQCVIYDSNKPGARLIGIEYIVSAKIFGSLPAEEKKLWHSHNYEVKSGVLTAPGMAEGAEKDLMKVLIGTYGKTWHTWQVDRGDKLPMGIPQLMMAFTGNGQAKPDIVAERDKLYGSSAAKKTARADIPDAKLDPGADNWQTGDTVQLDLKTLASMTKQPEEKAEGEKQPEEKPQSEKQPEEKQPNE